MRVTWHRRARQDLRHIRAQIAAENPQAAPRIAPRILQAVELLAEQPRIGRVGRVPDTREFVMTGTPYIVAYRVAEDTLIMLRVLHGARLGNCLRHAITKLSGKLTAIASPVRTALRSQFHTLLSRARQRRGLRVFALGQRLRQGRLSMSSNMFHHKMRWNVPIFLLLSPCPLGSFALG